MTRAKSKKCLGLCALGLATCACALPSAADESVTSPYATGGEVTRIDRGNLRATYIHVFTNTDEAVTFASTGKRDLKVRYLVVGAGGAGGARYANSNYGGGGGGGGGVCETNGVAFAKGATWQVLVGKGATSYAKVAGSSSISNGVFNIETVPGGGNGANSDTGAATEGASGGGGNRKLTSGAAGTYVNSLFGIAYGPFNGANVGTTRAGGGGGGAGAAGGGAKGGEGLTSDITGESLVYGSGGGGGCGYNADGSKYYQGGQGGTRAGDGGIFFDQTDKANVTEATDAAANSGGGGGGAVGPAVSGKNALGKGADGIVVIRYDVAESPCEGGDIVTKTLKRSTRYTYIHTFTNPAAASSFINCSGRDLKVRYLVVGAGGAGTSSGYKYTWNSGAGGGGGGVCEKAGVAFRADSVWQVCVGQGASSYEDNAGFSSISKDVGEVELVPGGGNGGRRTGSAAYLAPTSGAAGGGGTSISGSGGCVGAEGVYESSILGEKYGPFAGGKADKRQGGGGAGAGGAGGNASSSASGTATGGAGLVSDITGTALTYGAGGGAGECRFTNTGTTYAYQGGLGGDRAGDGARWAIEEDGSITYFPATEPEANSGGGGGGGGEIVNSGDTPQRNVSTGGADGIVVIRYDYDENPHGLIFIVR